MDYKNIFQLLKKVETKLNQKHKSED